MILSSPVTNPLSVLPFGNVIAAFLPRWRKLARGSSTPNLALLGPLLQRFAGFLNFCRTPLAAGLPFLRIRSLVHDANQSTRGFFHRLEVSPILSLSAVHTENSSSGVRTDETKDRFQIRQEFFRG